jgi:hypothetical protein
MKNPTYEVTVLAIKTRETVSWAEGFRTVGDVETQHEIRAEVTFFGPNDEPSVTWLDAAAVDDLDLNESELGEAEEQAIDLAADKMMTDREPAESPFTLALDRALDRRNAQRDFEQEQGE